MVLWREWDESYNFPGYEVSDNGEIRGVDDNFKYILPQFWGKLSNTDPQWLVTLRDDEGNEFTVPVDEVTYRTQPWQMKHETDYYED